MGPLLGVAAFALLAWLNSEEPAKPDRVVLLPGPDGKVGKVVVRSSAGESLLDAAYAAADVDAAGKIQARTEDANSVRQRYGATLDARPPRPLSLRVYFVTGGDTLTPESQPVVAELKQELARRPAPEITVIGHTDRVGKVEDNDALSKKRAESVRALLVAEGIPPAAIATAGRGEREPLVPTADEVAEAQNRRVEIDIR
jgi:OOP family OmpA-OmpF porin